MRLFDAVTDPIIGALMDRTNGKFGKFRPFMVIGNLIMAVSILVLYCVTPLIPDTMIWARYAAFVGLYAVWVIGYTFQTSCTRSGQTVLTNDPKQRPLFTIFNTVGSLLGMGAMQFFAPILAKNYEGGYGSAGFFRMLAPVGIVISILLTLLAVIGIWEKDQPKYFGIGGEKTEKLKVSEYVQIIKENKPMQRLMVAGAGCKLALSIATNTTVLCMLYGCMMGNYDGLYLPMMVLGYVFSVPFFLLTVRTSQKKGQKASLMRYVSVALVCYVGVLVLLMLWGKGDGFTLSQIGRADRLSELRFLFCFGRKFRTGELAELLGGYAEREFRFTDWPEWNTPVDGGFLNGFIDLVFRRRTASGDRYCLVDWKTNRLDGEPANFTPARLPAAMSHSYYFLQYLFYTVALVKFLRRTFGKFDAEDYRDRFGGVYYLFLRGIRAGQSPNGDGVFFTRPDFELVTALEALISPEEP